MRELTARQFEIYDWIRRQDYIVTINHIASQFGFTRQAAMVNVRLIANKGYLHRRGHYVETTDEVPPKHNVHSAVREATNSRTLLQFTPSPCDEPTDAVPGTEEKIAVLEQRAMDGIELWHPDDRVDYEHLSAASSRLPERKTRTRLKGTPA